MSKGSAPRPFSVSGDEFAARYDAIFGNKERDAKEGDSEIISKEIKGNQSGKGRGAT